MVTVSPSGPPGLFKGMTTSCSFRTRVFSIQSVSEYPVLKNTGLFPGSKTVFLIVFLGKYERPESTGVPKVFSDSCRKD